MKCVVGLGNPEKKYDSTRHNIGARCVEHAVELFLNMPHMSDGGEKSGKLYTARKLLFKKDHGSEQIIFVKTTTYMNCSGEAVRECIRSLPSSFDSKKDLWIVHDEYALPFGTLKIDVNKSSAGHNGVQNIIDQLKTKDFVRFRIGIKNEREKNIKMEDFVLERFSKSEEDEINNLKEIFVDILQVALEQGVAKAQNKVNKNPLIQDS